MADSDGRDEDELFYHFRKLGEGRPEMTEMRDYERGGGLTDDASPGVQAILE